MKRIAKAGLLTMGIIFLMAGNPRGGFAEPVLVNGGFETGDYTGWVIEEKGGDAKDGTWGIAHDGQVINRSDAVWDFFDQISVSQSSFGLPRTYVATDGSYSAIHLQNNSQDYRLYQDVSLPENATNLSWDMFYDNKNGYFSPDQYLAVHIRDLGDNILQTLFVADDSTPLAIPMNNFVFDISSYAGSTVRIDVEVKARLHYFDTGFDNFRIGLAEVEAPVESPVSESAPPGWSGSKGKKPEWSEYKSNRTPLGFEKGQKKGWER